MIGCVMYNMGHGINSEQHLEENPNSSNTVVGFSVFLSLSVSSHS